MNRQQRRNYVKSMNTPFKIEQYSKELDYRIREEYRQRYEEKYQEEIERSIHNFIVAIVYSLHFSEETAFDNDKVQRFMKDLLATIELFRTEEATPETYKKALNQEGISVVISKRKEKK